MAPVGSRGHTLLDLYTATEYVNPECSWWKGQFCSKYSALAPGNPTLWCWVPVAPIQKSFRSSGRDWKPGKKLYIPCKFCTYRFIRYSSSWYGMIRIDPLMANIRNPDFFASPVVNAAWFVVVRPCYLNRDLLSGPKGNKQDRFQAQFLRNWPVRANSAHTAWAIFSNPAPHTSSSQKSMGSLFHYSDIIMNATASQITSLTIIYSTVYSGEDQRKYQSSASLAFVWGIHRWPVNSPHKGPVTRKMFPFDDVIKCKFKLCSVSSDWIVVCNIMF